MIGSSKPPEPEPCPGPLQPPAAPPQPSPPQVGSKEPEVYYKKLWEESQAENQRLRLALNTYKFDLAVARRQLQRAQEEKLCQVERVLVVQKIARMEGELQEEPHLKSENKKLVSENKALSRVVEKL